jgi:hypothetical protein
MGRRGRGGKEGKGGRKKRGREGPAKDFAQGPATPKAGPAIFVYYVYRPEMNNI